MIFLKNGTLLFIFLYAGLLVNNSTCNIHEIIIPENDIAMFWQKIENFIDKYYGHVWENEYRLKGDAHAALRQNFDLFEKFVLPSKNDHDTSNAQWNAVLVKFKDELMKISSLQSHGNSEDMRNLFMLRALFELFESFIVAKQKENPCETREEYVNIKRKNTANIESIQIWMFTATSHHPHVKNDFEKFESQVLHKKFRISFGTFMRVLFLKNNMSKSVTVSNEDKQGTIDAGKTLAIHMSLPFKLTLPSYEQSFDISDNGDWVMKIVNSDLKKYKPSSLERGTNQELRWKDRALFDLGQFCIILRYEEGAPTLEIDVHNTLWDDDFEFKTSGKKHKGLA